MTEYVSDSEQEFSVLPAHRISASKVRHRINKLPEHLQLSVLEKLRDLGYLQIVDGEQQLQQQEKEYNNDDIQLEQRELQHALQTIIPAQPEKSTGRRGLRKRTFASTHPYLADQAHWLDLANIDYLNDIYEENQDLETMLKFLNQRYIKLKNRYPKEERYKSKSFFTFLGRSNPNTMNGALSQADPNVLALSQVDSNPVDQEIRDLNFSDDESIAHSRHKSILIEDSEGDNGLDDSDRSDSSVSLIDLNIMRPNTSTRHEMNHINISDNDNDSSISSDSSKNSEAEEETIVKVGGRVRRQKNILKGVLPESAKRLDIWTGKKRVTSAGLKKKDSEKRKGLATKKRGIGSKFRHEQDLYSELFVNDDTSEKSSSEEYMHIQNQKTLDEIQQVSNASHLYDSRYSNYYSVSESETEPDIPEDTDLFVTSVNERIPEEKRQLLQQNEVVDQEHAFSPSSSTSTRRDGKSYGWERSEIDPDIIKSSSGKSLKETLTGESKRAKPSGKGFRKLKRSRVLPRKSLFSTRRRVATPRQQTLVSSSSIENIQGPNRTKEQKDESDKKEINNKKGNAQQYYELPPLSDYSKAPIRFTPVFEAESAKKFVKQSKLNYFTPRQLYYSTSIDPLFKVDISKLHKIKDGYLSIDINELLITHMNGKRYAFNLVVKDDSRMQAQELLHKISKSVPDSETTNSINVLIYWYLTLQEPPSDTELKLLKSAVRRSNKNPHSKGILNYLASLICLNYIFVQLSKRFQHFTQDMEKQFEESCGFFLFEFFEKVHNDIEDEISLETDRYFNFFWQLLSSDPKYFWKVVNGQLSLFPSDRPHIYLEGLFYVANKIDSKFHNWEGFYIILDMAQDTKSSIFHKDFLDVVFLLNQRKSWPLEEKIIIKLYSTVTKLRFFNFDDEGSSISILPKIYTFNDIPSSTFFERFMGFLYHYISSLSTVNACKRTVTKLLTSSHYHYESTKRHQSAFSNRFNFIILLSQLSTLNQINQVNSLVELIIDSHDVDIYLLAIKELGIFSELMNLKNQELPLDSFRIILKKTSQLYLTVPGIAKVLVQLSTCLKHSFKLDVFSSSTTLSFSFLKLMEELSLKDLKDDVSIRLLDLICTASKIIGQSNETISSDNLLVLRNIVDNVRSFASQRMGYFPTKTRIRESRLVVAIEDCFVIWVKLTSKIDCNWNKLIFQEFPYMGNSYSRDKFILNFFCNILVYDDLEPHMGLIIDTLLKLFSKFHTSRYAADILNSLKKRDSYITDFKAINMDRSITEIELNTNRLQIVLAVLSNIVSGSGLNQMKTSTFVTFIECLNEEYDKYFKSSVYVEYCKKIIEFLQVHWPDIVEQDLYQEMANKLGITPMSINQLKWKSLPKLEKLSFLHKELVSSIFYEKDAFLTLDQYTDSENMDILFHLISIYMKCIAANQSEYWLLVSILMEYLVHNMENFKVDTHSREFAKFLLLLKEMTGLCFSRWSSRFTNVLTNLQLKSICQTYTILKLAYFIYEGYKDQEYVIDIIKEQYKAFTIPPAIASTLEYPYSSFNLYDISNNKQEVLSIMETRLLKPEIEKFHPEEQLASLELLIYSEPDQRTTDFDLEFF